MYVENIEITNQKLTRDKETKKFQVLLFLTIIVLLFEYIMLGMEYPFDGKGDDDWIYGLFFLIVPTSLLGLPFLGYSFRDNRMHWMLVFFAIIPMILGIFFGIKGLEANDKFQDFIAGKYYIIDGKEIHIMCFYFSKKCSSLY